jgi:hypothetical protein
MTKEVVDILEVLQEVYSRLLQAINIHPWLSDEEKVVYREYLKRIADEEIVNSKKPNWERDV